jgi:hypothetical protein
LRIRHLDVAVGSGDIQATRDIFYLDVLVMSGEFREAPDVGNVNLPGIQFQQPGQMRQREIAGLRCVMRGLGHVAYADRAEEFTLQCGVARYGIQLDFVSVARDTHAAGDVVNARVTLR